MHADQVVVGKSLFQIIFVTAFTTLLHAKTNYTVDIVLAVLLLVGHVIGAQVGTRPGTRMKAEQLRILLALMVLAVCRKLGLWDFGFGHCHRCRLACRYRISSYPHPIEMVLVSVAPSEWHHQGE